MLIVINGVGVMCVSHAKATHLDPCIISLAELETKDLVYMPCTSYLFPPFQNLSYLHCGVHH